MKRLLVLLLFITALSGCSYVTPGGISDANIPITDYSYVQVLGPTQASKSVTYLFWLIPIGKADIRAAMDEAMRQSNADALVDITWEKKNTFYFFLPITKVTVTVKGTAVQFRD